MSSLHDNVREALKRINIPKLEKDLLAAGMLEQLMVHDGQASLLLHLKPAYVSKSQIEKWVKDEVSKVDGISRVEIEFTKADTSKSAPTIAPEQRTARRINLPDVKKIITVFSGKGGVGKSTVSVNLAAALAELGASVALFDGDVHGPNIPQLLGITEKPMMKDGKILAVEKYGMKTISMGLLVEKDEALIWRGPMITKAINELLSNVEWGELDFMIIDLPPGTGDAQLGLAQDIEFDGSIAVTTPQEISLSDVRRGIATFKKLEVPLTGLVENMSYFVCPHCGEQTDIFGTGGGQAEAERQGVPLLGRIPLDPALRECGDNGTPFVLQHPDSPAALEFKRIAEVLYQSQHQAV